jgi:hypothetical protein
MSGNEQCGVEDIPGVVFEIGLGVLIEQVMLDIVRRERRLT